jgi:hypothetical protein
MSTKSHYLEIELGAIDPFFIKRLSNILVIMKNKLTIIINFGINPTNIIPLND